MPSNDLIFTILGIDKGSPAFKSVGDSADKAGDKLDKFGSIAVKAIAGSAAASVAGGLAIGAAVGAVPLVFAGMAAAALAQNEQVSTSFSNLASNVTSDVQAMVQPLQDDLVGVANDLGKAWAVVKPSMQDVFADPALGKGVRELSQGVGDFARNIMPGMIESVRRSEPVMSGFHTLLGETGTGASKFFTDIAQESESSGRIVAGFGGIVRTTLDDLGDVVADLSSSIAPHMDKVESLFDKATGSVSGLASGALPVLAGAAGATASALTGVLGILEPISGTLGTGLGVTLAAAAGWKVLTGAGNAYTKLDLGGKMERGALSAGILTESLTGSATAGERVATAGSRFGSVLGKLGTALPFVGLGVAALGLALDASNSSLEKAKQEAGDWAQSLIKGGSEADRVRLQIGKLNDENRTYQSELDRLAKAQGNAGQSGVLFTSSMNDLQGKIDLNNTKVGEANKKYHEIRDGLTGAELAHVKYNEAVERSGASSEEAVAAGAAWRAALDEEKKKQDAAAEATKTHTDRIIEQQTIMLGAAGADLNYRQSLLGVESAQQAMTDAIGKYGPASMEARQATLAYEESLQSAIAAAGQKALADNASKSASEQATLQSQAQAREILNLAAAAGDKAPASLMNMVRGLDATTLAAIGVTGRVTETGDAIYTMPDGKEIRLTGNNADAKAKIDEINRMQLLEKTLFINQVVRVDTRESQGLGGRARGGPVQAGQVVEVGEEGRELAVFSADAEIIPHSRSEEILAGLNRSPGPPSASSTSGGGPMVVKNYYLTIQNAGNSEIDLVTQFERMEQLDGAGL